MDRNQYYGSNKYYGSKPMVCIEITMAHPQSCRSLSVSLSVCLSVSLSRPAGARRASYEKYSRAGPFQKSTQAQNQHVLRESFRNFSALKIPTKLYQALSLIPFKRVPRVNPGGVRQTERTRGVPVCVQGYLAHKKQRPPRTLQ